MVSADSSQFVPQEGVENKNTLLLNSIYLFRDYFQVLNDSEGEVCQGK